MDALVTTAGSPQKKRAIGPGRILVLVYGIFAVAAGARAMVQIATKFDQAPVAYLLSALAAMVYLVNAVFLGRESAVSWKAARATCIVELVGVVVVGTISLVVPDAFPDATVWSQFGLGYALIPLLLPILGLAWLGRTRPAP